MVIKILIGLAVVIVLLVVVIALRPSAFRVTRSAVIAAPPERSFELVNDFRAWPTWSPWEKKDPQMKRTLGGPPGGVGASYAWAGDKNVGEGRMTIDRSERPSLVGINLEFIKPFPGVCPTVFTFDPAPGGTKVTWTMDGKYNFITKGMSLVMNMDKMIGNDFEAGLAAIKAESEAAAKSGARATAVAN
jgi:uncharacterized protein YndB with AHSA1/START domain